ncbi:uncharacterized protein LOC135432417 [Drosophila montana]|uniref:uncharacterized protein LOC135432417 n=1 Tax=Drosophila montana TaxID=40370 RepID=UPI00313B9A61
MLQFDTLEAEEELLIDFRDVRLVGRDRALNGTVFILEDMDDENFQFSLDFRYDANRHEYESGGDCPLSQGTYYVKNVLINSDNWPGIIPIGGIKVNLRFYKQYKFVGGLSLTFNVERQLL